MELDKKSISNRIESIRKEKGLSQEEFGLLIDGAHKSLVSKWEKGMSLPNNKRQKLIATLGKISVNELLYGSLKEYAFNFFSNYLNNNETISLSESSRLQVITESVNQVIKNDNIKGMYAAEEFRILDSSLEDEIRRSISRLINGTNFTNYGMIRYSLKSINDIKAELKRYSDNGIDENLYNEAIEIFSNTYKEVNNLINKYK